MGRCCGATSSCVQCLVAHVPPSSCTLGALADSRGAAAAEGGGLLLAPSRLPVSFPVCEKQPYASVQNFVIFHIEKLYYTSVNKFIFCWPCIHL